MVTGRTDNGACARRGGRRWSAGGAARRSEPLPRRAAVKNRHAVLVKKQAKPEKPRAKKRKPEEEPVSPAHAAVAPPPKLPPVRTSVVPRCACLAATMRPMPPAG